MRRLLAIARQLSKVGGKLLTDDRADCCCATTGLYQVFVDCCDSIPRFVVSPSVMASIRNRCVGSSVIGFIVRLDDGRTCYRESPLNFISLEAAQAAGYEVIEDDTRLTCVETSLLNSPARCYTTTCPLCSSQCCLTGLYRKQCPELLPDLLPKANVCCSYGRQATRTEEYSTRVEDQFYTSLNVGGDDPFCPPGCYSELFLRREIATTSGRQVIRFTQCDANGNPASPRIECISGQHYRSQQTNRKRWNFLEPLPTDTNCLQNDDLADDLIEERIAGCIGVTDSDSVLGLPFFPRRPWRTYTRNADGSPCVTISESGGDQQLCEDLQDFRTVCTTSGPGQPVTTTITNFRMSVACFQGSYTFEQVIDVRAGDDSECPAPGSLIRRTIYSHTATYSILVNAREGCAPNVCDGYAKSGTIAGAVVEEVTFPSPGALGLL